MVFRVWNDGTFAGTGRLPGRDVKRDLAMHLYISYLSHSVQLCGDDIMLTLRIVPGEIVPGNVPNRETSLPANVPSRRTSRNTPSFTFILSFI